MKSCFRCEGRIHIIVVSVGVLSSEMLLHCCFQSLCVYGEVGGRLRSRLSSISKGQRDAEIAGPKVGQGKREKGETRMKKGEKPPPPPNWG